MDFPTAVPKPKPKHLTFDYVTILPGQWMEGWVVGPAVAVDTHYFEQTKPCRCALSRGALPCVLGKKCKPRVRIYLPFFDPETEKKVVVMLSASLYAPAMALSRGSCIKLVRPNRKNNPPLSLVTGHTINGFAKFTLEMRKGKPYDIKEWLLHLWQDRVLTEHLGATFEPSPRTESGKQRFE